MKEWLYDNWWEIVVMAAFAYVAYLRLSMPVCNDNCLPPLY